MFKLPDFLRPIIGHVIGGVATIAITYVVTKVPVVSAFIPPDATQVVTDGVLGWLFANGVKQAVNLKVNPTNASSPALAASVPQTVVPKSVGSNVGGI